MREARLETGSVSYLRRSPVSAVRVRLLRCEVTELREPMDLSALTLPVGVPE